jgi:hypothetical protein
VDDVRFYNNGGERKVLLVDGLVAMHDDCCCEEEGCEPCAYEPTYYSCVPACYDLEDCIPKYMLATCSGFSAPCAEVNGEWVLHCYNDAYSHVWAGGEPYHINIEITTNTQQSVVQIIHGSDICINKTDTAQKCAIEGSITDGGKTVSWEPCDESGGSCLLKFDEFIEVTIEGVSSYAALWYEPDECYYGPSDCDWANDTFILTRTSRFSLTWQYTDESGHIVSLVINASYSILTAGWGPPTYGDPQEPPTPWCDYQEGAYATCFIWGNIQWQYTPCLTEAVDKDNNCPDHGDCSWDYFTVGCGGCKGTASWEVI